MEQQLNLGVKSYNELRSEIRSGDLLLCSGNSVFSSLIQKATNSIWSHVGFILRIDEIDRIMLLESVESIGVRAVPLSSYTNNYNGSGRPYPGKLVLARHDDVKQSHIKQLSRIAVDLLGYPYRMDEIVEISARISMYRLGVENKAQALPRQRGFICSEYTYACFKSIGITIDYNPMGYIAPADFACNSKIKTLSYIRTEDVQYKNNHARELEMA